MKVIIIDNKNNIKEEDINRKETKDIFSLNIRDLRPIFSYLQVSTILPRKNLVIINLGFVKAILSKKNVYLFSHNIDGETFQSFLGELKSKLKNKKDEDFKNFFLTSLETILETKARQINEKIDIIEKKVKKVLSEVHKKSSEEYLQNILSLKKKISQLEIRVNEILSAGREVLEDDENFSELIGIFNLEKNEELVLELESILENFIEQFEENLGHIKRAQEDIEDTDEYLNLSLSSQRTHMAKIDLIATLISGIFAFMAVVVGSFGMNLRNNHENSFNFFLYINIGMIVLLIILLIIFWIFLKKKKIL